MDHQDRSVLIVDDNNAICFCLKAFFEDHGFKALSAQSAEEALDIIKADKFDIGIIDLSLPAMDGETFIIKAHEIAPSMKFLVQTGSGEYVISQDMIDCGLSEGSVILKPNPSFQILIDKIHSALNISE